METTTKTYYPSELKGLLISELKRFYTEDYGPDIIWMTSEWDDFDIYYDHNNESFHCIRYDGKMNDDWDNYDEDEDLYVSVYNSAASFYDDMDVEDEEWYERDAEWNIIVTDRMIEEQADYILAYIFPMRILFTYQNWDFQELITKDPLWYYLQDQAWNSFDENPHSSLEELLAFHNMDASKLEPFNF